MGTRVYVSAVVAMCLICCFLLSCATTGQSREPAEVFYVSPNGDDSAPGTVERPLATLAGARDRVRSVLDGRGDVIVYFRDGYYRFAETVVFGLRDSGSRKQKITYGAYPGETPIFTSGVHVSGWRPIPQTDPGFRFLPSEARGHVHVADIPDGLGLIRNMVDGNESWLDKARVGVTDLVTTEHFKHCRMVESEMWDPPDEKKIQEYSKSMEGLSNADTALELRIYTTDYNMNLLPVASIDGSTLTTTVPGTYRLAPPPPDHRPWKGQFEVCWIENLIEGLDKPGEWVCNTATGKLYLWPLGGTERIYAPTLTEFVRVEGNIDYWAPADEPVRHVNFDGITFTNGERTVWEEGDAGVQHDWGMCDKANALLRFRGAENCAVTNCTFRKSGGVGVRFDLHAQNNTVEKCLFEHLGDEAVQFCGYGVGAKDVNKYNTFAGNEIRYIGRIKWDVAAINVWNSGYNRIAGNYIHHCPYKCVLLSAPRSRAFTPDYPMREQGWPMARWNEVSKDAQSDVVLRRERRQSTARDSLCSQYRYTRGNIIEKNTLHDMSEGMWGDGIFYVTATGSASDPDRDANKIIGNYIYDTDGNSEDVKSGYFRGIYLDSFIGNVEVHRNVWYNCSMTFEANHFALSRGEGRPKANIFYDVTVEDGDHFVGRRFEPQGTLMFGRGDSDLHDPSRECLDDYIQMYHDMDRLPGVVRGREEVKRKLEEVIAELGGRSSVSGK